MRAFRQASSLLVLVLFLVGFARPAVAAPACDWLVYDAARGDPQVLFTDPDATPPAAMRVDAGFDTQGGTPRSAVGSTSTATA